MCKCSNEFVLRKEKKEINIHILKSGILRGTFKKVKKLRSFNFVVKNKSSYKILIFYGFLHILTVIQIINVRNRNNRKFVSVAMIEIK